MAKKKRDDDIVIPIDPPWRLTDPVPELVAEVVTGEVGPLRDHLGSVVVKLRRTPINILAALRATSDVAAWLVAVGEAEQDRRGVPAHQRLDLEQAFAARLAFQLPHQRRRHAYRPHPRRG